MLECKYHNYPHISVPKRGQKCICQSCMQSRKDIDTYKEINKNHITGLLCKKWTQCKTCTTIQFYRRLLKHFAYDGEKCGKNCDACKWNKETVEEYEDEIEEIVAKLYGLLLGQRVSGWRVARGRAKRLKEASNHVAV